jgi:hypothetical protein
MISVKHKTKNLLNLKTLTKRKKKKTSHKKIRSNLFFIPSSSFKFPTYDS